MVNSNKIKNIVSESIRKVLKEENENNNKIIDLISFLHNAQLPLREIHWNTRNNALHLITDETIKDLFEWEDTLAEAFISDTKITVKINSTKPNSNEFSSILKELINLTNSIKTSMNESDNGICAVIDDILECCNKYLYRGEFK